VLKRVALQEPMKAIVESIVKLQLRFSSPSHGVAPLMAVVPAPTRLDMHYYTL
jgi:hypothetical protein